jgi:hypothetical protein
MACIISTVQFHPGKSGYFCRSLMYRRRQKSQLNGVGVTMMGLLRVHSRCGYATRSESVSRKLHTLVLNIFRTRLLIRSKVSNKVMFTNHEVPSFIGYCVSCHHWKSSYDTGHYLVQFPIIPSAFSKSG